MKPYGLGFGGHANCCDCTACVAARVAGVQKRLQRDPEAFKDPEATIFVRAHFRRGKHLTKYPNTARSIRRLLQRWEKERT